MSIRVASFAVAVCGVLAVVAAGYAAPSQGAEARPDAAVNAAPTKTSSPMIAAPGPAALACSGLLLLAPRRKASV
ncbi:MAG: hypothetical protein SFZ24_04605 [Planctomycetota bacterium]|nr:hypothetical protein [Planctomycetota bacterium]